MRNEEPRVKGERTPKFKVKDLVIHKDSGEAGKVIENNYFQDQDDGEFKFDVYVEIDGKCRTWMREEDLEPQTSTSTTGDSNNVRSTEKVEIGNRKMQGET